MLPLVLNTSIITKQQQRRQQQKKNEQQSIFYSVLKLSEHTFFLFPSLTIDQMWAALRAGNFYFSKVLKISSLLLNHPILKRIR